MRIAVDLDGTICEECWSFADIPFSKPRPEAVHKINQLYAKGHRIIIYTGRLWEDYDTTVEQLRNWEVHYHMLVMNKPIAELYVDNRSCTIGGLDDLTL